MQIRGILGVVILSFLCAIGCDAPAKRNASPATMPSLADRPDTMTLLFFGLGLNTGGTISVQQWQGFVDAEIATRFPDGFTILSADGEWRSGDNVYREPSRVLMIIHDGEPPASHKIDELRAIYKRQFQQDAVLRLDSPVGNVSF